MSDLPITITLDPAPAVEGSKRAAHALVATEEAAKRVKQAMRDYEKELAQVTKDLHDLEQASKNAGNAIARQRQQAQQAASTIGLGPTPKGGGGGAGGALGNAVLTGAAMAGATGVADVVMKAASAWIDYEKAQDAAFNSLRKYFTTAEQTNTVLEAQTLLAAHLSVDVREQAEAFAAVREASEDLHVTTLQQIDATRTLSEVMQMQGKPVGAAAEVMKQLQVAMELGTITGRQFKTLLTENDDVVELLTARTGKSAKQLQDMATAGKFNRDMIKEWFLAIADGGPVHEEWNKRVKVGSDLLIELSPMLKEGMAALKAESRAALEAADQFDQLRVAAEGLHAALQRKLDQKATIAGMLADANLSIAVAAAVAELKAHNQLIDTFSKIDEKERLIAQANKELADGRITLLDYNLAMNELQDQTVKVHKAVKPLIDDFDRLHAVLAMPLDPVSLLGSAKADIEALQAEFDSIAGVQSGDFTGFAPIGPASFGIEDSTKKAVEAAEALKKEWADVIEAMDKAGEEATKFGDIIEGQLISDASTFSNALVDAAHGADVAWTDLGKTMLRALGEAIVQAAILKALTGDYGGVKGAAGWGGIIGALGGATGFDYLAGSSKHQAPGFATGGDMYTRGGGSTDSMLAMVRITPGESLHVRTPDQRREATRGQGGGRVVIENRIADPRDLLPMSRGEETRVLNVFRKYPDAVKSLLP